VRYELKKYIRCDALQRDPAFKVTRRAEAFK
jgi:hypothetical protein